MRWVWIKNSNRTRSDNSSKILLKLPTWKQKTIRRSLRRADNLLAFMMARASTIRQSNSPLLIWVAQRMQNWLLKTRIRRMPRLILTKMFKKKLSCQFLKNLMSKVTIMWLPLILIIFNRLKSKRIRSCRKTNLEGSKLMMCKIKMVVIKTRTRSLIRMAFIRTFWQLQTCRRIHL